MREDLQLAGYAVSQGFSINAVSFLHGIPADPLTFTLKHGNGDNVVVWQTSRGWRVAQLKNGVYPLPQNSDFHNELFNALISALSIRKSQPDFNGRETMRFIPIPSRASLYRCSPEELDVTLKELDALVEEVSNARREMIHRAGGKSEHKQHKQEK